MSHLKNPPRPISLTSARRWACLALAVASGCAAVQIPSYRLEECAAASYSRAPCLLPPVPLPGWLARWKAEKNLPKPPAAPRFHPLPTRPMFQAQPTPPWNMANGDEVCFGELPAAESWRADESAPITHLPSPPPPILAEPL